MNLRKDRMTNQKGTLIISLDFELYWGLIAKAKLESYAQRLLAEREVVLMLLKLFEEYKIHATWAVVGLLFFENKDALINGLPKARPAYEDNELADVEINNLGNNEQDDPFHYAPSLIREIISVPGQEVASHTFSHLFCLEKGQDAGVFKDDLEASLSVAKKYGLSLKSIVFPENQVNEEYLTICRQMGIRAYRGLELHRLGRAQKERSLARLHQILRLINAYINVSGYNSYTLDRIGTQTPFNIRSSRFLRYYVRQLGFLEPLRLRRINSEMTYAARKGQVYHLWWHPYNFSTHTEKNMVFLRAILDCFSDLHKIYGMESLNMAELSSRLLGQEA